MGFLGAVGKGSCFLISSLKNPTKPSNEVEIRRQRKGHLHDTRADLDQLGEFGWFLRFIVRMRMKIMSINDVV